MNTDPQGRSSSDDSAKDPLAALAARNNISTATSQKNTLKKARIASFAFFFAQGLCFASWASRIPDLKTTLQLSEAELGSILLALPGGQLTAMPVSGRLVTRFGSKPMMLIALVLYAFALTNIGLAEYGWHLALALYIFGICGNLVNISANTQGISVEAAYGRPLMTSFHGGWSLAGFAGAGIGTLMIALKLSPYIHFWIVAVVVCVAGFFIYPYLLEGVKLKNEKRSFFSKPDKELLQLGLIAFCCMACEGTMFDWSGVYFQNVVMAPAAFITVGYAGFMCTMAGGRFAGDGLIHRFGPKVIIEASGVLIATGLLLSVLFPYFIPATLGFLIVGIGVSSVVPTVYSATGRSTTVPPGIALATVSSVSFLGFLLGPPLIGYIAELANLRYSFAVIALLGLCTSILASKSKLITGKS